MGTGRLSPIPKLCTPFPRTPFPSLLLTSPFPPRCMISSQATAEIPRKVGHPRCGVRPVHKRGRDTAMTPAHATAWPWTRVGRFYDAQQPAECAAGLPAGPLVVAVRAPPSLDCAGRGAERIAGKSVPEPGALSAQFSRSCPQPQGRQPPLGKSTTARPMGRPDRRTSSSTLIHESVNCPTWSRCVTATVPVNDLADSSA